MREKAIRIVKKLQDSGFEAVFAGGCVRDMLMGIEPKDFDIATSALPMEVKHLFPRTIAVGESFGVIVVLEDDESFEVATFRKDSEDSDGRRPDSVTFSSMKEDALRRDLTINGLFFDPIKEELFDFVGGRGDIEKKIVRFIGDPSERIKEDHLRILRAVRFFSKEGWDVDIDSAMDIQLHRRLIADISAERIKEELEKILLLPKPSLAFNAMNSLGILEIILPELTILETIPQNPRWHGEGNAFVHTMLAIDTARKMSDDPIVLWGTLFHDLGKGKPRIDEDGKLIFHDHDEIGTDIAKSVMRRLKFSNDDRHMIASIVRDHMRVKHLPNMRKAKVRHLMASNHFDRLLLVSDIDSRSSLHEDHLSNKGKRKFVEFAENFEKTLDGEPIMPKPLINGHDLMDLGIKEGREIGNIKKVISDLHLDGVITSREEAIELVRELIEKGESLD